MKKFCSLLIVFCLLLSLSACGGNNSSTDTNQNGFCTKCGEEISATDKFCGSCGAAVDKSTNSETTDNTTSDNSSDSNNITTTTKDNSGLKSNPQIATAYINELKNGGEFGDINFAGYYLYDIDKDGCEELIIKAGTCEADASILFYRYVNGEVKQLGNVSGGHSSLCGNAKEDSITIHYGTGGYEWVDSVKIENESLIVSHIVSERETLNYTEFDYCVPLTFYPINNTAVLVGYGGVGDVAVDDSIDINVDTINTSATAFLDDCHYSGIGYISNWQNSFFTTKDPSIYNLELTGREEHYYFYDDYKTVTVRDGIIVGLSQTVNLDMNVYQLLKLLGENAFELTKYEPEIIFDKEHYAYLKWKVNNGYMVIYTAWVMDTTDWKKSMVWNYCIFSR